MWDGPADALDARRALLAIVARPEKALSPQVVSAVARGSRRFDLPTMRDAARMVAADAVKFLELYVLVPTLDSPEPLPAPAPAVAQQPRDAASPTVAVRCGKRLPSESPAIGNVIQLPADVAKLLFGFGWKFGQNHGLPCDCACHCAEARNVYVEACVRLWLTAAAGAARARF